MNFVRQFAERPKEVTTAKKKKSNTVQGAILSNQKLVDKFLQGNMYGVTMNANVSYDSDDENFDENSVVHLDRSDRLISLYQLKNRQSYLQQIAQAEIQAQQQVIPEQSETPADVAK